MTQNSTNTSIIVSPNAAINYPSQPLLIANVSTTVPNVTGDATEYTVIFNNVSTDTTSGYNNSTGIFTAQDDGFYLITSCVTLNGIAAGNNDTRLSFNNSAGPLSYDFNYGNAAANSAGGVLGLIGSNTIKLLAGDQFHVSVNCAGSPKGVGIYAPGGGTLWTTLSIFMIA